MLCTPPTPTLFPYTTLFRSQPRQHRAGPERHPKQQKVETGRRPMRFLTAGDFVYQVVADGLHDETCAGLCHDRQEPWRRSEEHTSELQSLRHLVCRLLLEKK